MEKFKIIIALLNAPRLLIHILFYFIFFDRIKDDIRINAEDRIRYGYFINFLMIMIFHKPFRNLFYYRIGNWKYLMWYFAPPYETFLLGKESVIAPGFLPAHPFSTVVNADYIGKNCMVFQDVTIGVSNGGRPTIGDNVTIYSHALVCGKIKIGNNVIIGGGSVVCKDVPDNCTVVGNPAKIIKRNGKKCDEKL